MVGLGEDLTGISESKLIRKATKQTALSRSKVGDRKAEPTLTPSCLCVLSENRGRTNTSSANRLTTVFCAGCCGICAIHCDSIVFELL